MPQLRKMLLGLALVGLSLGPVYAAVNASEHARCHSPSSEHHRQVPSCCKAGQCDCSQACAVALNVKSVVTSDALVVVATRIDVGLYPVSGVRFFRPPIA